MLPDEWVGGRLVSRATSTPNCAGICYDSAGRLVKEVSHGRRITFQYDAASNRSRVIHPDNNYWQYSYDALNRVDLIRENGSTTLADYNYDALGRRATITRASGPSTTFSYDNASRLTGLTQNLSGTANDQSFGFSYTAASQVSQRSASNDLYSWITPTAARTYTRNGLNQYTAVGGASFSYDARGNLTSDGGRTFVYDLENRRTSVSGSASMTLSYDPLGRLRRTAAGGTTTDFLYEGDALSVEYVGANIVRRYVHGPGVDEPLVWYEGAELTDRRYLVADRQGSIIAANGSSTTRYAYGPYGEPDAWTGSRFRYTGQAALPEVRLYHYKARVFVSDRVSLQEPTQHRIVDALNLHLYVNNDPLNLTDSTGMSLSCVASRINAAEGSVCGGSAFDPSYGETTEGDATLQEVNRRGNRARNYTPAEQLRVDLYGRSLRDVQRYDPSYAEVHAPGWVPTNRDVARIGDLAQNLRQTYSFFESRGIAVHPHALRNIVGRADRGVNNQSVLNAYNRGRVFYDSASGYYIRRDAQTGVYVVTTRPSGGEIRTATEGPIRPRWNPVPYRD